MRAPVHLGRDFLLRREQAGVRQDAGGGVGGCEGFPGGEDVVGWGAARGVQEGDDGVEGSLFVGFEGLGHVWEGGLPFQAGA